MTSELVLDITSTIRFQSSLGFPQYFESKIKSIICLQSFTIVCRLVPRILPVVVYSESASANSRLALLGDSLPFLPRMCSHRLFIKFLKLSSFVNSESNNPPISIAASDGPVVSRATSWLIPRNVLFLTT